MRALFCRTCLSAKREALASSGSALFLIMNHLWPLFYFPYSVCKYINLWEVGKFLRRIVYLWIFCVKSIAWDNCIKLLLCLKWMRYVRLSGFEMSRSWFKHKARKTHAHGSLDKNLTYNRFEICVSPMFERLCTCLKMLLKCCHYSPRPKIM